MHDDVQDAPDHAPGVVHVQVDLLPELHRLELLGAKDDVAGAVLDAVTSHIPELEVVSAGQNTLQFQSEISITDNFLVF